MIRRYYDIQKRFLSPFAFCIVFVMLLVLSLVFLSILHYIDWDLKWFYVIDIFFFMRLIFFLNYLYSKKLRRLEWNKWELVLTITFNSFLLMAMLTVSIPFLEIIWKWMNATITWFSHLILNVVYKHMVCLLLHINSFVRSFCCEHISRILHIFNDCVCPPQ